MRSANLAKLESLAEDQADYTLQSVERQRMELSLLERQQQELRSINHEYQNGVVALESVSPQLLAHRRAFVEQLSQKLDLIDEQREQQGARLSHTVDQHREQTAQSAAIGALKSTVKEQEQVSQARQDQRLQDDQFQSLNHVKTNKENEERA